MKILVYITTIFMIILLNIWIVMWDSPWSNIVTVTTDVPWVSCWPQDQETWEVECLVQPGFWSVQSVIGAMIRYFSYLALLWAVLFIIINGITYSMAGLNDGLKATAKDRIMKTLMWLILLLLSWFILNTVAPWVYR